MDNNQNFSQNNNQNIPQNNGQNFAPNNGFQQYGQMPFNNQPGMPPVSDGKAMSIAALVLGILSAAFSTFFSWTFPVSLIFLVCGIVGIVLAVLGRKKSTACYGRPSGMATAGFVLSIIGTTFSALFLLSCLACYACGIAELAML